jgi:hypothetical protein
MVSEHLEALGRINLQPFFSEYLNIVYNYKKISGIIVDSTSVPNDININLTKISNYSGLFSNEIRLIYVIDRIKKLPLYFRVVTGNITEVSTLQNIINQLNSFNINTKYSVLNADCYSNDDIKFLYANKIDFIARTASNRLIGRQLIRTYLSEIIDINNNIVYNDSLLYIKKFQAQLYDYKGYTYIAVYHKIRNEIIEILTNNNNDKTLKNCLSNHKQDIDDKLLGTFILLSSLDLKISEILPYYSSENYIEQTFDGSKNIELLTPRCVHSLEGLIGHILLNFLTIITYMSINKWLNNTNFSLKNSFFMLGHLPAKFIYPYLYNYEPQEQIKPFLKFLNIPIPKIIDLKTTSCFDNVYFKL